MIYLFQSGAPSQMDLFDYKPKLAELRGTELPDSIRQGQRLTAMTATQSSFPVAPSIFAFARPGQSGAWISELMPHTAQAGDDLCFIKSMHTEAINHDPAITFFQTGAQLAGRPSIGAWLSYGLGSENQDLPAFILDLKQRGMLDDTMVIWGGEFGRTVYCQGRLTAEDYGRDHHPRCFTIWMAGGGIKAGMSYGETDDYGYNVAKDPVHVHDLQATILHCLGIDHEGLTYRFQGRDFRLTNVAGQVVKAILS